MKDCNDCLLEEKEDFIEIVGWAARTLMGDDCNKRIFLNGERLYLDAGEKVGVQKEGFHCRKDNMLLLRNIDCGLIGERPLTEDEIYELDKRQ